jgi:hypothetical protein
MNDFDRLQDEISKTAPIVKNGANREIPKINPMAKE